MDSNLIYILFICVIVPLQMMLVLVRGHSKYLVGFMMLGMFLSLFVSEFNTLMLGWFHNDVEYVTTTMTPISEELIKAIPVVIYVFAIKPKKEEIIPVAFALGIGFALFENMEIFVRNINEVSYFWAIIRGFSAAVMHGICTTLIGYCSYSLKARKKMICGGLFALFTAACIYHGIYNMLVQSDYAVIGYVMPLLTYNLAWMKYKWNRRKETKAKAAEQTKPQAQESKA